MENSVQNFLSACDEFIDCKFLVAEYKLQKMLQALSQSEEICSLVGECLEQFNREREFAKAFLQDGHGNLIFERPEEEYKIIALVFCTLVDIENKKIDFVDFIKSYFGREENPFQAFIQQMVIPFRNLIAEAFGQAFVQNPAENTDESEGPDEHVDEEYDDDDEDDYQGEDKFAQTQKVAVQMLSELQYLGQSDNVLDAAIVCRAIIKTAPMHDSDVTYALAKALAACKVKQVKFLMKEIEDILDM